MNKEELKKLVIEQIDKDRNEYIEVGTKIYQNPETGFREFETTKLLADSLRKLDYEVDENIAYTGCRAYGNPDKKGFKIAFLGELDSVINKEHPDSEDKKGAVHACGHNIQSAVMYGVASALKKSNILEKLDGQIDFIGIPAEEYIELDYRAKLKEEGKINYYSGKQELTYRGGFDDVDMVMMIHSFPIDQEGYKTSSKVNGTGFVGKSIEFIGKETHAGGTPHLGINALNMATIAINSMHIMRETFRDEDNVRVHQIITKGGDSVNTVPQSVMLETCIRANNVEALNNANEKINNCVHGSAITMGGQAVIKDMPGYLPMNHSDEMAKIYEENAKLIYDEDKVLDGYPSTASFDIGDLSMFMPMLHPITSGIEGGLHGRDYKIIDLEDAYINPIKIMACTVIDMLYDSCKIGKEIKDNFEPIMTKEEYLQYLKDCEKEVKF